MKTLVPLLLLILTLPVFGQTAAYDVRIMQRNAANTGNLTIDLHELPGSASYIVGYDGANRIVEQMQLSANLSYDGTTLSIAGIPPDVATALAGLNAGNLTSGTVPDARFPSTLPALSGTNLTNLNATALTSGTVPDGRFPATLPAVSGVNLTALNASNMGSGTVPDARFPSTLPALSGVNLTALNASNFGSGTVPVARLGSGSVGSGTKLLADNNTWITPTTGTVTSVGVTSSTLNVSGSPVTGSGNITVNIPSRSFNNTPNRSAYIVTVAAAANGFQISSTRDAMASYSITIQANATGLLAGASSGYVLFEIAATNSSTAGDWSEIGRWTNGQTFTSILTLTSNQPVGCDIMKIIPAGYYVRFRSVNVSGTPTFTYNSGQECLL